MSAAPFILALDISKSNTGICEGRVGEVPKFYSIKGKDDDVTTAVARLFDWLTERTDAERTDEEPPDVIYYEAPISAAAFMGRYDPEAGKVQMTSNPDTTVAIAKMTGIVELIAYKRKIEFVPVHVQTARKSFLGAGNLKGPEAKRRAFDLCKLIHWSPNNRDESDAACVWYFAATKVAPRLAQIVTPMEQHKVATTIGGVDLVAPLRKRAGWKR